jgi:hypothetical protein
MLQFYTSLADKFYPNRWWFGGVTGAVFALLLLLFLSRATHVVFIGGVVSGPAIAVSWGLLCMCAWFHPTQGKLYSGSLFNRLPVFVQAAIRWYFVAFLTVWFAFGLLVWPTFALWGEGLVR